MAYLDSNPIIGDPSMMNCIYFKQTPETMMDPDEYGHFIYNIESTFRKLRFYKDYKCAIMQAGINYDQQMKGITSDMASIEMHHHLPTLKDAVTVISEYYLRTVGQVNTCMVLRDLVQAHRSNIMGVIMLSVTNHQVYHNDPSVFISIDQLYGNPFKFLEMYGPYFTLDIAYKWLLQFKQEEQYNRTTQWANIAKARDQLLDWSKSGTITY